MASWFFTCGIISLIPYIRELAILNENVQYKNYFHDYRVIFSKHVKLIKVVLMEIILVLEELIKNGTCVK